MCSSHEFGTQQVPYVNYRLGKIKKGVVYVQTYMINFNVNKSVYKLVERDKYILKCDKTPFIEKGY